MTNAALSRRAFLRLRTWQDGGDQLDIQSELDKLAIEADECLATER